VSFDIFYAQAVPFYQSYGIILKNEEGFKKVMLRFFEIAMSEKENI
jgi:hypothetical protein